MDLTKLNYDISLPGLVIDNYPELRDYPAFQNPSDDIYLKLAILMTDENSPIVKREKQFKGIVESACSHLEIESKEFVYSLLINDPRNPEASRVFALQDAYFRLNNNWEFQTWYDLMYQYHENSILIRTSVDPSDKAFEAKSKIKQDIRKAQLDLQKNIVAYENQIFPRGTNIKKVLTQHVAKVTNWPERMAREKLINA
jgi:hypothetical protein